METIIKDITTVEKGMIVHQVNCKSAMGSGVALAIKNKWPDVYTDFMQKSKSEVHDWRLLGEVQYVLPDEYPDLVIVNLFGQYDYGKGIKHTEYAAWDKALRDLKYSNLVDEFIEEQGLKVHFPYNCGCDRGGGEWSIISKMIEFYLPEAVICKLP